MEVALIGNATQVTVGWTHTCVRLNDASVRCWGDNYYGQLGDGTRTETLWATADPGLADVRAVRAGELHTCAVTSGGALYCWGRNDAGGVGDRTRVDRDTPALVRW